MKTTGMFATFWKAEDLAPGETVELEVAGASEGDYGLVIEFADESRLTLNMTNGRKMQRAYGDETDLWIGKVVSLRRGETTFKGELVSTVVLEPVSPPLSKEEKTKALAKPDPLDDSDIPF